LLTRTTDLGLHYWIGIGTAIGVDHPLLPQLTGCG
jgi:hypothetical protein